MRTRALVALIALVAGVGSGCIELFAEPTPRAEVDLGLDGDAPASDADRAPSSDGGVDRGPCVVESEACNGLDDDCDGVVDEALSPPPPQDGVCAALVPVCAGVNGWVFPSPVELPRFEIEETRCDAQDDDCDGRVDEGMDVGALCEVGQGICLAAGMIECGPDGDARCSTVAGEPRDEPPGVSCNGLDDDCDGVVDEGQANLGLGWRCRIAVDGCALTGRVGCGPDPATRVCLDAQPADEQCNSFDDDCDGQVDEGCRAVDLDTRDAHACAVQATGEVDCWGSDPFGAAQPWRIDPDEPDGRAVVEIATGPDFTCARDASGRIVCQGRGYSGLETIADGGMAGLCAADRMGCSVSAGANPAGGGLGCWGARGRGGPEGNGEGWYADLSCGFDEACGTRLSDRTARCWTDENAPFGQALTQVAVGQGYRCGTTGDGALVCWLRGDNAAIRPDVPVGLELPDRLGRGVNCGLLDGAAVCWSIGEPPDVPALDPPAGPLAAIRVDRYTRCAIRGGDPAEGAVECWGPFDAVHTIPPRGLFDLRALRAGVSHTCGLDPAGAVRCWGADLFGALTDPDPGRVGVQAVAPHHSGTCLIDAEGALRCWGRPDDPLNTPPAGVFDALACAATFCCARYAEDGAGPVGSLGCWGSDPGPGPDVRFDHIAAGQGWMCGIEQRAGGPGHPARCWGTPAAVAQRLVGGPWDELAVAADFVCLGRPEPEGRARGVLCFGDRADVPAGGLVEGWSVGSICATETGVACGIDPATGAVSCRGAGPNAPVTAIAPEGRFEALTCGARQACAVDAGGRPVCWGAL